MQLPQPQPRPRMPATLCQFCRIADGSTPAHVAWADDEHVAFLDHRPLAAGHLLLIPRVHCGSVYDLPPDAYARLFERVRALAAPLARPSWPGRWHGCARPSRPRALLPGPAGLNPRAQATRRVATLP